ncbi:preprotein translocase subunit YajC [Philodulcilactobacillus myokoensis]|uniref:Preprotein translocase subunit YajC n=1 Tax=Philodulcilactobacillus myokoensis TaxID=2929573 RepID=A0A9W6B213_9LACO|nr:preprotein translocase subunit YajC [Philodulcilactobacillus myokoensis]GLB46679.1 preprotein translocase subunit YajC [Philodulcilactobacillus myokoensis]
MQSGIGSFVLIIIFIAVMWFLMIRPQKKQQQKHRDMVNKLQKGDHVVTIGRLHGVIQNIDKEEKTVTLDCDGIYLVFDINAIANVKQQSTSAVKPSNDNHKNDQTNDDSKSDGKESKDQQHNK